MMQVLNRELPSPISTTSTSARCCKPNYLGFLRKAVTLPLRLAGVARELVANRRALGDGRRRRARRGAADRASTPAPASSDYVAEVLVRPGPHQRLPAARRRALPDRDRPRHRPSGSSSARRSGRTCRSRRRSQCSTALPIVYKPVELKGRQFIDGGIRSTTNVDIAVEKGAKFIVVVNPLVPYVNDFEKRIPTIFGTRVRRVSDMGLPAIANQTFRLIAHDRLHQAVEIWQERYPGVDIILIEPELDDELMFGTPIMDYSRRLEIANHGFESVTATLARDYDRYKEIAERHGLEISARRVRHVVERVEREEPSRPRPGAGCSSRRPRRSCATAGSEDCRALGRPRPASLVRVERLDLGLVLAGRRRPA